MEFSVVCHYYSYLIGERFPVWFSCVCLKPDDLERLRALAEPAGEGAFARQVLYALEHGDCRLSYRGTGSVVFAGHEFLAAAAGDSVTVRFNDDCIFTVRPEDVTLFL